MVYNDGTLDRTFAALADPTRRAILARLAGGEAAISDLARPFAMSLPAVSKHLQVLSRAGLTTIRREGRVRRCRLVAEPLRGAAAWMEFYRQFWEGQLDRLAQYLGEPTPSEESTSWSPPSTPPGPSGSRSAAPSRRPRPASSRRGPRRRN